MIALAVCTAVCIASPLEASSYASYTPVTYITAPIVQAAAAPVALAKEEQYIDYYVSFIFFTNFYEIAKLSTFRKRKIKIVCCNRRCKNTYESCIKAISFATLKHCIKYNQRRCCSV